MNIILYIFPSHLFIYTCSIATTYYVYKYTHSLATWEPSPNDLYMSTLPADWTFIGVGAGAGMFLLFLVLSLVVALVVVVVVVRRRAAQTHKQKSDLKMGVNLDPNSIAMQEKETCRCRHALHGCTHI